MARGLPDIEKKSKPMEKITIISAAVVFVMLIATMTDSIATQKKISDKKLVAVKKSTRLKLIEINRYRRPDRFYNKRYIT